MSSLNLLPSPSILAHEMGKQTQFCSADLWRIIHGAMAKKVEVKLSCKVTPNEILLPTQSGVCEVTRTSKFPVQKETQNTSWSYAPAGGETNKQTKSPTNKTPQANKPTRTRSGCFHLVCQGLQTGLYDTKTVAPQAQVAAPHYCCYLGYHFPFSVCESSKYHCPASPSPGTRNLTKCCLIRKSRTFLAKPSVFLCVKWDFEEPPPTTQLRDP